MDLEEFTEFANQVVDSEVPEPLLDRLNLGIIVVPEAEYDEEFYVLGHYSVDRLGRHVALFYGSFAALFEGQPREVWEDQIRETIRHELRHHVETLAGDRSLAREEREARLRARGRRRPGKQEPASPLLRILQWLRARMRGDR